MPRTVITFGTFDVFHVGHLRVLERAAALGDRLVVGVSADALNVRQEGPRPRLQPGRAARDRRSRSRWSTQVFVEESLEQKRDYILEHGADVLVMGDDWAGKFDEFGDVCEVVYLRAHAGDLHHRDHRAHRGPLIIASAVSARVRVTPEMTTTRGTMRRIVTTAVAIALMGGGALRPPSPPTTTVRARPDPSVPARPRPSRSRLTPEPALPVLEEQAEPRPPRRSPPRAA